MNTNQPGGEGYERPPVNESRRGPLAGGAKNPAAQAGHRRANPAARSARKTAPGNDATRIVQPAAANGGGGKGRKKKKHGKVRPSTVFVTVLLNLLKAILVVVCIFAIGVSVAAVQVVDYVVTETSDDDNKLDLENIKLNETSFIMAYNPNNPNAREERDYVEYQELIGPENRVWVELHEIPDNLINAVVATEDRAFEEHHGVNIQRTVYALANELFGFEDKSFGASTIEQQLVKNITDDDVVASEEEGKSAGYKRKMREIFRAWGLDNQYSKDMIMEAYMNTMSLSERIAGVQAAANEYFDKDVEELTLSECATIAGITRAPTYYSPYQNPKNCLKRRNDVLYFMEECGFITKKEFNKAVDEPLGVTKRTTKENSNESRVIFNYFSDTVFNAVVDDLMEQKGWSREKAVEEMYTGGYRIYATVEPEMQQALENIFLHGYEEGGFFLDPNRFPGYQEMMTAYARVENEDGSVTPGDPVLPQCSAAVINYDGELVGVIGGIGEKTVSLGLNRAVGTVKYKKDGTPYVEGTVRQTGSTMKMVADYPVALDQGVINYSTGMFDGPVLAVNNPGGAADWPMNYGGTPGRMNNIPIAAAIQESTNTVAVRVGEIIGSEAMYEFATETLQVSSLVYPDDVAPAPMVLGALTRGMSAYELAGCYQMYGGNDSYGVFNSLHCYTRVEDAKGNLIIEPEITTVQAIDPQTGYVGNKLLQNVVYGGVPGIYNTGHDLAPYSPAADPEGRVMPAAGKTGTTSDDNDRWFVGLTPYYVMAGWWGYDANDNVNQWSQPHTLAPWNPNYYPHVPGNVFKTVMEQVQADMPYKDFPDVPEGVQALWYCTNSGALASAGCPSALGYYTTANVPDYCPGHVVKGADRDGEGEEGEGGEAAEGGEAPAEEG